MAMGGGRSERDNPNKAGRTASSRSGSGKRRNDGIPSLLKWMDPRGPNSHYVEGQTPLTFKEGDISIGENARRLAAITAQQAGWAADLKLRQKIKPIKDPAGDKSEERRTSAKRKRKGRVGTTTLAMANTLG